MQKNAETFRNMQRHAERCRDMQIDADIDMKADRNDSEMPSGFDD